MSKGRALLLGVNEVDPQGYDGKWDGKLNFCESDATAVAEVAQAAGFSNTLLLTSQVTKAALVAGITEAANDLQAGDIFLLYFSGHGNTTGDINGDEAHRGNARDETLCLYDNQILDDEFYALWQKFAAGVRILVLTDACHSGSILRGGEEDLVPKALDERTSKIMKRMNPTRYAKMREALPPPEPVQASVMQLAGCREDQLSYESRRLQHGQFTAAMLKALADNAQAGEEGLSYVGLFRKMEAIMPDTQKPVLNKLGVENEGFNAEPAFTIA